MEFFILMAFLVIAFFAYTGRNKNPSNNTNTPSSKGGSETAGESFLAPIPKGKQIFSRCDVSGISFRKDDAIRFAKGTNLELELEREPFNTHDENAIKVIGKASGKRYFIGYIPKELSEQIAETGLFESIAPRLDRIYQGSDGYLEIKIQIIGPKVDKQQFDAFFANKPIDSIQKDFYKFFGLSVTKGLTTGNADKFIKEHRKTLEAETPSKLKEYDSYRQILEEFDDEDFRESYDLKKVSRTVLLDAINQLMQEGKTYENLADDIDELVDRVLKLNPALEKG